MGQFVRDRRVFLLCRGRVGKRSILRPATMAQQYVSQINLPNGSTGILITGAGGPLAVFELEGVYGRSMERE